MTFSVDGFVDLLILLTDTMAQKSHPPLPLPSNLRWNWLIREPLITFRWRRPNTFAKVSKTFHNISIRALRNFHDLYKVFRHEFYSFRPLVTKPKIKLIAISSIASTNISVYYFKSFTVSQSLPPKKKNKINLKTSAKFNCNQCKLKIIHFFAVGLLNKKQETRKRSNKIIFSPKSKAKMGKALGKKSEKVNGNLA